VLKSPKRCLQACSRQKVNLRASYGCTLQYRIKINHSKMQSMLLLLTASICVCHAAPDKQKKHDAEKICCKTLDIHNDLVQFALNGQYSQFTLPDACLGIVGLCLDPKIKKTCAKECAAHLSETSACQRFHVDKEKADAGLCDSFDLARKEIQMAYRTSPSKMCAVAHACKIARAVGKCKSQCDALERKCKDVLVPPGPCDKTCFHTGCATSEFCMFCPQTKFKSCKTCKPGCKLRKIDINGHYDCKGNKENFLNALYNDVVVVKGRNLRRMDRV